MAPLQAKPQPFFTVDWKDGKAWFTAPSGKPFLSMGVNAIGDQSYRASNENYYNPVKNQYDGNKKAWMKGVFIRLKRWHFNSIGGWADEALLGQEFPYTDMLYLGRGSKWDEVLLSVFSDDFAAQVKENAQKAVKYKDDPFLIGYFLDNEMPWWGDYGWHADGQKTLLQKYALKGVDDANKEALKKFFEDRYGQDIEKFDQTWGLKMTSFEELEAPVTLSVKTKRQKAEADAWAGVVADRYFSVTTQALRAVDPNHLILGVRRRGESPRGCGGSLRQILRCGFGEYLREVRQYQPGPPG